MSRRVQGALVALALALAACAGPASNVTVLQPTASPSPPPLRGVGMDWLLGPPDGSYAWGASWQVDRADLLD